MEVFIWGVPVITEFLRRYERPAPSAGAESAPAEICEGMELEDLGYLMDHQASPIPKRTRDEVSDHDNANSMDSPV